MAVRHSRSVLLACAAIASLIAPAVWAQSVETAAADVTPLKKIVVSKGARVPGAVAETPLAQETTQEEIEDKQVTSIDDLGRSLQPGVSYNRTTGAVNIRGLEGSRVLTTVDGIPLSYLSDATRDADGGVDSFDFSSISAVDVVRGADSSRAGSGALGGVFALRTLEADDLIAEGRDWGGVAKFTYDGSDKSYNPAVAVAKRFENTSVLFQGSYRKGDERRNKGDIDTYGPTRTEANPSDYNQHNLLFKLRQKLEGGHTIGVTAETFRRDRDTDLRTSQSLTGNYRPGNYDGQEDSDRDRVSLDYRYESESADSLLDSVETSLYWLDQTRLSGYTGYRSSSVIGPIGRANSYEEKAFGLIGSASKDFSTGDYNHHLTFGWDLARVTAEQYSAGYDNCRKPYTGPYTACNNLHTNQADTPKVDTGRIGLFIDDEIAIAETGWSVTPGLRFDWIEHDPKMTDAYDNNATNPALPGGFSDTAISPKLRVAYQPHDGLELYGQWAMGFRAPTAGELYAAFGAPGTYLRVGNPALESETSNGFELGANIGDDDFGGRVNVFYNRYKNFIDTKALTAAEAAANGYVLSQYPQGGITQNVNLDRARIFGVELGAHKRFDNGFSVRAGLAYANGKDMDTGAFIQSVAPLKGVLSLGYDTENWGVGLDWITSAAGRGESTSTYFKTPGYGIVDLTAWYEPEQIKGMKINAGVYNVFDKTYYDYANARSGRTQPEEYYSEAGRYFKVSITQRF